MEENVKRDRSFVSPIIATAFALFAMLFGSGNIVLPLGLGRELGSMAIYAMVGFFLTAVLVPMLGIVAMALYDGNYREFVERAGKIPGNLIIFVCLCLIGPFYIIPRCMATSYGALEWIFPGLSLFYFSLGMAVVLFLATIRKNAVVSLMGLVLGPLKWALLTIVIIKGFFITQTIIPCEQPWWRTLQKGFIEGFGTLDLVAVIILSGLLLDNLRKNSSGGERSKKEVITLLVKAGALGSLMLGVMYAGFIYVSASQSGLEQCMIADRSQLLSILSAIVLGAGGGILASVALSVACATTAIALTTVFAEYVHKELTMDKLPYIASLVVTLIVSVFFANYGFEGIQRTLMPVVVIFYPALIVLACTNIIYKAWNIELGKFPFYVTLAATIFLPYLR